MMAENRMLDRIRTKLEQMDLAGWELTETAREGWEFYFIRHQLDQNRAVQVRETQVKVYRLLEDGKMLGSASGIIEPTASEEEIEKQLSNLAFQASLVRNPAWKLQDQPLPALPAPPEVSPEQIAEDFIRTIASVPETETEDINSYEIFVNKITRTFRNSNGVCYTWTYPSSEVEVVVNARRDGHEIELHNVCNSGTCDKERLAKDIAGWLQTAGDRLAAQPTPPLQTAPVVFSTADAREIWQYFSIKMNAQAKVRKLSDWEPGQEIAPGRDGDAVTLEALALLPNSSRSIPVDAEGSLIKDQYLIRDGVAENFFGSRQFSQYIGLEKSAQAANFRVSGGTKSAAEIRQGDFLEVVEFSDFQVDPAGGDIAGEIRLAYRHHDGDVTIVSGGSVTGNMLEAAAHMHFSRETAQYDNWVIPAVTKLDGLTVTGIEQA